MHYKHSVNCFVWVALIWGSFRVFDESFVFSWRSNDHAAQASSEPKQTGDVNILFCLEYVRLTSACSLLMSISALSAHFVWMKGEEFTGNMLWNAKNYNSAIYLQYVFCYDNNYEMKVMVKV